ncbi:39S ribosomal protein L48, mitochondrial-like [Haliotis rufescens]|uniref:39S ribosomal protein L48, mitochondrial-like n=1 Tax=Haliotis rufescens TaxID=6454 RepID=UPI001EB054FC|nr:39S ribosomal protein L48, mitochondrial-like [Haliotis rufescens]
MQSGILGGLLRTLVAKAKFSHTQNVCQHCRKTIGRRHLSSTTRLLGVFEPDNLTPGPAIPEYEALNVRMRGYDFALLESFAKYVHNQATQLGIDTDMWPSPSKATHIETYVPNSKVIQHTYDLRTYERTVQLQDVPSTMLPIFLDIIRSHLPMGVNITLKEPDVEEENDRYVPDKRLKDLYAEVDAIQKARDERRKK